MDFYAPLHSSIGISSLLYKEEPGLLRTDSSRPGYIRDEQDWPHLSGFRVSERVLSKCTKFSGFVQSQALQGRANRCHSKTQLRGLGQ